MWNVLLDPLPEEWNGYRINTDFSIGIQLMQVQYDNSLNEYEKFSAYLWLLFGDEEEIREHPEGEEDDLFEVGIEDMAAQILILLWDFIHAVVSLSFCFGELLSLYNVFRKK